jgi:dienelactone hydrolase
MVFNLKRGELATICLQIGFLWYSASGAEGVLVNTANPGLFFTIYKLEPGSPQVGQKTTPPICIICRARGSTQLWDIIGQTTDIADSWFTDKKRIAAIGYCFGGTTVLALARSGADVAAVVRFHGGLSSPTPADTSNIRAKVLALHAVRMTRMSPERRQRLTRRCDRPESNGNW